jgi:hypothetical protein
MLTRFAKIFVVIVTFSSIALMGVAITASKGGPSWDAEAENLPEYIFKQDTTSGLWSVKYRKDDSPLKSGVPHPAAVAEAYRHATELNNTELEIVEPQIEPLEAQKKEVNDFRIADEGGLKLRKEKLKQEFDALSAEANKAGLAAESNAQAALATRTKAAARREDGQRLILQLEGIETDHFHLQEQRRRLLDSLFQMRGLQLRLRDRNAQLRGAGYDDAPVTPTVPNPATTEPTP